jgi:hypothetical protein
MLLYTTLYALQPLKQAAKQMPQAVTHTMCIIQDIAVSTHPLPVFCLPWRLKAALHTWHSQQMVQPYTLEQHQMLPTVMACRCLMCYASAFISLNLGDAKPKPGLLT